MSRFSTLRESHGSIIFVVVKSSMQASCYFKLERLEYDTTLTFEISSVYCQVEVTEIFSVKLCFLKDE